jgi:hypothetical protein
LHRTLTAYLIRSRIFNPQNIQPEIFSEIYPRFELEQEKIIAKVIAMGNMELSRPL